MKAVKANKVYTITEAEKQRYIDEGYDICNDKGEIIAYGRGKTVPMEKYLELQKELETLKAPEKEEKAPEKEEKAPKKEKKEKAGDA